MNSLLQPRIETSSSYPYYYYQIHRNHGEASVNIANCNSKHSYKYLQNKEERRKKGCVATKLHRETLKVHICKVEHDNSIKFNNSR